MIHPNMATMISVITTDANISRRMLDRATEVADSSQPHLVDGDTSGDKVLILAMACRERALMMKDLPTVPLRIL